MRRALTIIAILALPALTLAAQAYEEHTVFTIYDWNQDGREDSVGVLLRHPGDAGARGVATEPEIELECNGSGKTAHAWASVDDAEALAQNLTAAVEAARAP